MQYAKATEEAICKLKGKNKVLMWGKWKFCHNWTEVGNDKLMFFVKAQHYYQKEEKDAVT